MRFEDFIAQAGGRDLIIGEDLSPECRVNAGVFVVRASDWSRRLFRPLRRRVGARATSTALRHLLDFALCCAPLVPHSALSLSALAGVLNR